MRTARPIEVVNWTNEEGARFPPAMMGSGVFSARFDLADALGATDADGMTVSDAIDRIGYRGALPVGGRPLAAALELHIEQGPILEENGCEIGVVTGVQGARWFDLKIEGEEAHAGSTPMSRRTDPVAVLGRFLVDAFRRIEGDFASRGRLTFGVLAAEPASRNTVPGGVTVSVDLRHPDESTLDDMEACLRDAAKQACLERGAAWRLDDVWRSPPVRFSRPLHRRRRCGGGSLRLFLHADGSRRRTRLRAHERCRADGDDLRPLRRRHQPQRGGEHHAGPGGGGRQRPPARGARPRRATVG